MKGFIQIGWTLAVLVTAVLAIIAFVSASIIFKFRGTDPLSYSLQFVRLSNEPYLVAGSLTQMQVEDRQFIEHAIEASVVGSLSNSESGSVLPELQDFFNVYRDAFDTKSYGAAIMTDAALGDSYNILDFMALSGECGPDGNKEGQCVPVPDEYSKPVESLPAAAVTPELIATVAYRTCGVLRLPIAPEDDDCWGDATADYSLGDYVCCKHVDSEEEWKTGSDGFWDEFEVVNCGEDGQGVCTNYCDGVTIFPIGDLTCETKNVFPFDESATPICCTKLTPQKAEEVGLSSYAEIPLFYKGLLGHLLVYSGMKLEER